MKKSDFYKLEDNHIYFIQTGNQYSLKDIKQVEVVTKTVLKGVVDTVLNSIANAAVSSIGNGDEKVNVLVRVHFDTTCEDIKLNEEILVKGNLDYYEMVEHAHKLRDAIKKDRSL